MSRPVIAWRGVLGWLLMILGSVLAYTASAPLNGATLAGCVLIALGGLCVGSVIAPAQDRGRHGRR